MRWHVAKVTIREYKDWPLSGGTLLVSVPQFGLGSVLLTDHILDAYKMDHYAAVDCDDFPPIAMVRKGKARYPMRIHADPASRLAVLRSELQPAPYLTRPIALGVLRWAAGRGIGRVVVLDNLAAGDEDGNDGVRPTISGIASGDAAREHLRAAGVEELDEAVLGGIMGILVLEARFMEIEVIGLVAELRTALDEAQSMLAFAETLPLLVPGLRLDLKRLRSDSREITETLRSIQSEVERTLRKLQPRPASEGLPIYG